MESLEDPLRHRIFEPIWSRPIKKTNKINYPQAQTSKKLRDYILIQNRTVSDIFLIHLTTKIES